MCYGAHLVFYKVYWKNSQHLILTWFPLHRNLDISVGFSGKNQCSHPKRIQNHLMIPIPWLFSLPLWLEYSHRFSFPSLTTDTTGFNSNKHSNIKDIARNWWQSTLANWLFRQVLFLYILANWFDSIRTCLKYQSIVVLVYDFW